MNPPRATVAALASLAAACTWGAGSAPVIAAVTPAEATNRFGVQLTVTGRGFDPPVSVDFDRPGRSTADAGFTLTLTAGAARVALDGVQAISSTELRATLPGGAPPETYDVELRDPHGGVARLPGAFRLLEEVPVTTSADEADPGATAASPGGTGLSLREAVAWVNARGAPAVISLAGPMTITMVPPQTDMTLTAPGAAIVGAEGVVLDFGGVNQNCLTLDGPGQRLSGVTLRGCTGTFVAMSPASGASQVAGVTFDVTGTRYWAYGILAQATSALPSRIGPGNRLSGLWYALKIDGGGYEIFDNDVVDNAVGARIGGGPVRLWRNRFVRQVKDGSNRGNGVELVAGSGPAELLHDVFDGNGGNGLDAGAVASLTVRNCLFTGNAGIGLNAQAAGLLHDHDGYFGNAGGDVAAGLGLAATEWHADPRYVDAATGDYRLAAGSPAIDAGVDTGLDVNGDAPGLFDGLAPDLGAFETP